MRSKAALLFLTLAALAVEAPPARSQGGAADDTAERAEQEATLLLIERNAAEIGRNAGRIDATAEEARRRRRQLQGSVEALRRDVASLEESAAPIDALDEQGERIRIHEELFESRSRAVDERLDRVDEAGAALASAVEANAKAIERETEQLAQARDMLMSIAMATGRNENFINRFWILMAAILVLFMQVGFTGFEVGVVRGVHANSVGMKNLIDWLIVVVAFYVIGFGLMFGTSVGGWVGADLFMPSVSMLEGSNRATGLGMEFFLFQMAFAATAATIVSGALAERTTLICYLLTALFISAFVYPLYGHWAWGGSFLLANDGWLAQLGFRDFAGSTVVHCIGAWVAWVGIVRVGARRGRFREVPPEQRPSLGATLIFGDPARVNREDFQPNTLGLAVVGVFLLWFGWWGFNGGSQLSYDANISTIILNTNVAGAFGGLTGFFLAYYCDRDDLHLKILGGALGGLVAITACCNAVSTDAAILIGVGAGVVHHLGSNLLIWLGHDDPVGAVPVHGFCGVFGTLCVALFGDPALAPGFFGLDSGVQAAFARAGVEGFVLPQLVVQLIGIGIAAGFCGSVSWVFFRLIAAERSPFVLRMGEEEEGTGSALA